MNRAERRRHERTAHKQPIIIAGDGVIAAELSGSRFEAKPHAQLPTKVHGEHRWIATVAYVLTPEAAAAGRSVDTIKYLDHENLMALSIGCWDCELPLGEIEVDSICSAPQ